MITKELLRKWNACQSGYRRFCELFPDGADLQAAMDGLIADGHDDWSYWLFDHCRQDGLYMDIISKGYQNSGDQNSGDWNSGHQNSGDQNSGNRNSGDQNSGDWNSGHQNSGHRNSGNWNSGNWNSGHRNSGHRNSGDQNSGHRNSGDQNSGHRNSGNWNSGNWNSGFFNSKTRDTILIFNKSCSRKTWEKAYKPDFLYFDLTYWVDESELTDEEKAADPDFYVRGGQLRTKDYKEAFIDSWNKADPADRIRVKDLPNFDAKVFYEISGIDVDTE